MRVKGITSHEYYRARNTVYFDKESIPSWLNTSAWIDRHCKRCGRWYIKRDSRGDYCGRGCSHAPGHTHATRNGSEDCVCYECGKIVRRYRSEIRDNLTDTYYCSTTCRNVNAKPPSANLIHKPDLSHPVRSLWEANVARWLNWLGLPYVYEPERTRIADTVYIPDFLVADAFYVEVKGWWRPGSREKTVAFAEQSAKPLVVLDQHGYKALEHQCAGIVPFWESAHW